MSVPEADPSPSAELVPLETHRSGADDGVVYHVTEAAEAEEEGSQKAEEHLIRVAWGLVVLGVLLILGLVAPEVLLVLGGLLGLGVVIAIAIPVLREVGKQLERLEDEARVRRQEQRKRELELERKRHEAILTSLRMANEKYGTQFPADESDLNRYMFRTDTAVFVFDPRTRAVCIIRSRPVASMSVEDYSWFIERRLEWVNKHTERGIFKLNARLVLTVADVDSPRIVMHFPNYDSGERFYAWLSAILDG